MVKRIAGGGVLCIAGMFMLLYARKLFTTRTWTFMLPGSDGPTAVFVARRIGNSSSGGDCDWDYWRSSIGAWNYNNYPGK